jgi:Sec-independent protein translocase protein TatA
VEKGAAMEFFGVGGMELLAILLIALIVAGPKRMIAWSYTLGRWAAQARRMWSETAALLQKELDDAGVDIKVPTEPPTRQSLNNEVRRLTSPVTKPLEDSLKSVRSELNDVRKAADLREAMTPKAGSSNGSPAAPEPKTAPPGSDRADAPSQGGYGTWSG